MESNKSIRSSSKVTLIKLKDLFKSFDFLLNWKYIVENLALPNEVTGYGVENDTILVYKA